MARSRRGRGEGSCFQRASDGLWVADCSMGTDPQTGRRLRMSAYGTTKRDALDRLAELKAKAKGGLLPDAHKLTVGVLLDKWLDNLAGRSEARTVEERRKVVRTHLAPRVGRVKLEQLNPLHVETLFTQMRADGVKPGAVQSAAKHLTTALNFAVKMRLIPHSPAAGVAKPGGRKRPVVVLDPAQASAVAAAARTDPAGPIVLTALGTGLRQGELLGLLWDDVDLRNATLTVARVASWPKGKVVVKPPKTAASRRTVALPPFVAEVLTAHKAEAMRRGLLDAPVFCTGTGEHRRPSMVWEPFSRLVKRVQAAIPADGPVRRIPAGFTFHGLRHTHASILLSTGHSLRAVSARLGHRDPALTLRIYAHVMPLDDAKLAAGIGAAITG